MARRMEGFPLEQVLTRSTSADHPLPQRILRAHLGFILNICTGGKGFGEGADFGGFQRSSVHGMPHRLAVG